MSDEARVAGLLLAAGAGSRMGIPKALVRQKTTDGSTGEAWVVRGIQVLLDSGCSTVVVVVGARAAEVEEVLDTAFVDEPRLFVTPAERWSAGLSESLRRGLQAVAERSDDPGSVDRADAVGPGGEVEGVVITLVDTPSLRVETVRRLLGIVRQSRNPAGLLAQATFGGRPGHPVYLGRSHWGAVSRRLTGDTGAKAYLAAQPTQQVECGDLESGEDVDSV